MNFFKTPYQENGKWSMDNEDLENPMNPANPLIRGSNFFKTSYLIVALVSGVVAAAQSGDAIKAKFPNAEAVYTNLLCEVNITVDKGGNINTTSDHTEDLLYLTPNAVKMMSRGHIYHSSFNVLKGWEAYTQLPERGRVKIAN